jgi:hypothetical protein
LSFTIAADPRQRSHSRVRVGRVSRPYFNVSDYKLPNLEAQVPVFISPRNWLAQLYPQAVGSPFVASYDSQDYGGGIRTHLHAGFLIGLSSYPPYVSRHGSLRIHCLQRLFYCCVLIRCHGQQFTAPLPSNDHIYLLKYYGFQQPCHNIYDNNFLFRIVRNEKELFGS